MALSSPPSLLADAVEDDQLLSAFSTDHARVFFDRLDRFLAFDPAAAGSEAADRKLVDGLGAILDLYLPAPPLLDPVLGRILPPLLDATTDLLRRALVAHPRPSPSPSPSDDSSLPIRPADEGEEQAQTVVVTAAADNDNDDSKASPAAEKDGGASWRVGRLERLGTVLWWILKVRSWKACLTHFPPSLPHLPLLLSLLSPSPHPILLPPSSWALRYVLLAHLSLVALVPFELDKAGGRGTKDRLWAVGTRAVDEGRGKEAEAGSRLVAALMARPDCQDLLATFLADAHRRQRPRLAHLETLAWLVPSASADQLALLRSHVGFAPSASSVAAAAAATATVDSSDSPSSVTSAPVVEPPPSPPPAPPPSDASPPLPPLLAAAPMDEPSALVRKASIKLVGRLGLRELVLGGRRERQQRTPLHHHRRRRRRRSGTSPTGGREVNGITAGGHGERGPHRRLDEVEDNEAEEDEEEEEDDDDDDDEMIGLEMEEVVERLLDGLEDKDTIVRWSAAKYLARLGALLPRLLAGQLTSAVVDLFGRDVLFPPKLDPSEAEASGGVQEEEAAAAVDGRKSERRTRRPDVSAVKEGTWHGACLAVAELARRGVLGQEQLTDVVPWLIEATTFDPFVLSHSTGSAVRDAAFYALWSLARCFTPDQIRPWAAELACACVGASVCDREVGIRRSGSAAFQEGVGRLGVYPEGIDVLSKTDFYAVGIRRNAFLVVSPLVAQHVLYRTYLIDRYADETLRHWDRELRVLAAGALRAIAEVDLEAIGPALGQRLRADAVRTLDGTWTHGLVLALGELAEAWEQSSSLLARGEQRKLLETITLLRPQLYTSFSADLHLAAACNLIAHALSPAALVDEAVNKAWRNIVALGLKSRKPEVWAAVGRVWATLKTFNATTQQALANIFGSLRFEHTVGCAEVVRRLLGLVEVGSKDFVSDVEARRNAFQAICAIAAAPANRLPGQRLGKGEISRTVVALLKGLDDYTSDQRGDVGSWIRLACLYGAAELVGSILARPEPEHWLTVDEYRAVLGKVLKLAVERIDGVRRAAGDALQRIVLLEREPAGQFALPGADHLRGLFTTGPDTVRWNEASSVIPRLVPLMAHQPYRRPLLEGLSLSIGSLSEGTSKPAAAAFLHYIATLAPSALSPAEPSLVSISRALVDIASANVTLNRVFIPILDTLVLLFEDSDLTRLADTPSGKTAVRSIFQTATKDLGRIRNIQRVQAASRIITGMLAIPACATDAIKQLPILLNHRFPVVRSATAEQLYLILQSMDIEGADELEDILLETTWFVRPTVDSFALRPFS